MKKLINKPYLVFWAFSIISILLGIFKGDKTIDINIYDTYFVFLSRDFGLLIAILFSIMGFGYWVVLKTNHKLLKSLTAIHLVITTIGIAIILISSVFLQSSIGIGSENYEKKVIIAIYILNTTLLILLLSLILYFTNIIYGIFNKKKSI
ncbi:hypothetical protein [Urechidicola croceus]|uniref:Uncharacterized protein n=1 Tax=Urechidicola croceus TaxID=1850246 RepID=A0A1D8P4B5_9FLAO|nr:hypothetical protein [Urechidicola croceus]AOW19396.1 hypothetical protein LPB138_01275 [Urechidicola croceus]